MKKKKQLIYVIIFIKIWTLLFCCCLVVGVVEWCSTTSINFSSPHFFYLPVFSGKASSQSVLFCFLPQVLLSYYRSGRQESF